MRILIACEESQVVTAAFRERGHEAYSCDVLPTSGGNPEWHFQNDVKQVIGKSMGSEWDMIIAFPPCTDLAVSWARWFKEKVADGRQKKSVEFFLFFTTLSCHRVAIENPVGIMSTIYKKPNQTIQPWQYGHGEVKSTCLWLKGLPPLQPTKPVGGRVARIWKMPPSNDRASLRSKTYQGIADAMASQWSNSIKSTP
jgi:site-specific DNA-cytosine methylase